MEALSLLMPFMQMGMSGTQSMMNTGLGLIPTAISLWDRFQSRNDPLLRRVSEIFGHRYNQSVEENPFGDPYGAWGGMFGQNDAGGNIGVGEGQARAINQMMQQNPAISGIENYQQLAQQQRPGVADTTSGLASLMGHESQFQQPYQQPNFVPATPDMGAALNTDFSGSPAPRPVDDYTVDERLFGRGGPGSNLVDMANGLNPEGLNNLLAIGGGLANRFGQGGNTGGGGGGIRPLAPFLQRPQYGGGGNSGGNVPYTGGLSQQSQQRLGLKSTPNTTTNIPHGQYWQTEAAKLGPNPKFGRIIQSGSGARPRPANGLRALGQMFIGQPRRF